LVIDSIICIATFWATELKADHNAAAGLNEVAVSSTNESVHLPGGPQSFGSVIIRSVSMTMLHLVTHFPPYKESMKVSVFNASMA
jgi:hypothetical protein